jgi:hypothetical protein
MHARFGGKEEGNRAPEVVVLRLKDNIKMNLEETELGSMDLIHMTKNRNQ